ncbi:coiled-coil domain-containing protein 148 isoform X1 [Oryzias melastigma]|uniref:Coiled-coil domain containing 148 n=1 Tax=Oryzias melastigma TaxID=30732 RepID=A0A3B3B846_ORYME|nr:coiled-coil domain-containing protein 148 isoform X1 [Oryzias melastigma]
MAARGLQTFITSYRAEDSEKLVLQMKNGLSSSRYRPAEHKRLQALIDAERLECDLMGQKVQRTCCAAKATKESSLLRQHRQVWSRECPRLQKAKQQAEDALQDFLEKIEPNSSTNTGLFSLQEYGLSLVREREAFRRATMEPAQQLRDELHLSLYEGQRLPLGEHLGHLDGVKQQIKAVKDHQGVIITNLHEEQRNTEEEIRSLDLEKYFPSSSDNLVNIDEVPIEVLDADCPYPELKESLIQAFQSMSESYRSRLQSLQEQLQNTDRFCGWGSDDHHGFQFVESMYTQDIPRHRTLCMDMLQRLFPEKTRQELVEHERLWDSQRFTQTQLTVVTQQWERDLEELLARALVTLQEAKHAHQQEMQLHRDRQHQQEICWHLKEKLQQWRAQQEEVAKLEAAIAARQREEEKARVKREKEKEAAVRLQHKEKVRQFYLTQEKRREALEQREEERLAALRSVMEEQARRDRQRVQLRADMLLRRQEERGELELERQREEQARQNRLEALRKQVEVVAEADPVRMTANTKAWSSRMLDKEYQKPLYSLNTYTDTQIVSDPRLRVEQALREAGLHQSRYATKVLSEVKPLKPPRRDTKSKLKF